MFSALSEGHGDLKNKINLFVALCPIVNLGFSNDTMMTEAAAHFKMLESTLEKFGVNYIDNPSKMTSNFDNAMCEILPC